MSFQFEQLAALAVYFALIYFFFKSKSTKVRLILAAILFIFFAVSPVRFKQDGFSSIEQNRFSMNSEIPERVYVDKKSFSEFQYEQMKELKEQSREALKNE